MKIINTMPIGTEVYYFDPVLDGEIEIFKSVILGCYINKNEGELYYQLLNNHAPAWSVSDTEEGIQILKRAFLYYREKLHMANAANKVRYNELRAGAVFNEFDVNNLPMEEKIGDEDDESENSANDE